MPHPQSISILMVLHNSEGALPWSLEPLPPGCEIVIVDNASTDGSVEVAAKIRPAAKIIKLEENVGFGAGVNEAARHATRETVVLLNPDLRIEPQDLDRLVASSQAEPTSAFGPTLLDENGAVRYNLRRWSHPLRNAVAVLPGIGHLLPDRLQRNLGADHPIYARGGRVAFLQGACIVISRRQFISIGGFDERFFLYAEEQELGVRIRRAGGHCVYIADATAIHLGGVSTKASKTPKQYYLYRSQVLYQAIVHGKLRASINTALVGVAIILRAGAQTLRKGEAGAPTGAREALHGLASGFAYALKMSERRHRRRGSL